MLALMNFMTKAYHLRKVDVLRLFIPSQMRGGKVKELTVKYASIAEEYRDKDEMLFIRPSAQAQRFVYHLSECGRDSVTELNKNFSAAALKSCFPRHSGSG